MNNTVKLLLIDDDKCDLSLLEALCKKLKFSYESFSSPKKCMMSLKNHNKNIPFLIISDINMPEVSGFQVLEYLKDQHSYTPIIFVSGVDDIKNPIMAMRAGAFDFLTKPINFDLFEVRVKSAIEKILADAKLSLMQDNILSGRSIRNFVGKSEEIKSIYEMIFKVARFDSTVLIRGESGVGKERVARAIHEGSDRSEGNFVAVNCASIPESLIESELFGYTKGAFTGADRDKIGLIEESSGGTLFLDEIGELPMHVQAKLLRVLQEKSVRPVGEKQSREIDLRVVCATHKNLEEMLINKKFREDLFYRLNVIPIKIPPLRERKEDLEILIPYILKNINQKWGLEKKIGPDQFLQLLQYDWPGNVRELENVLERAFVLSSSNELKSNHFNLANKHELEVDNIFSLNGSSVMPSLEEVELLYISEVMRRTSTKDEAAKILGIGRKTLYRKEEKLQGQ